ncbi:hypothetical protein HYV81_02330 [Candidatus Woesearchaeota archaeon]|nr:hypothetical protein [Candidatus Woesearchaeota archaeon]
MAHTAVLEEKPLTMADMKEELARIRKRDGELNFRANKTDEYLTHFVKQGNAQKLVAEIAKLGIPRLKESHIVKIVDLHPATVEQLKAVLQGYTLSVSDDNLKKIINVLKT